MRLLTRATFAVCLAAAFLLAGCKEEAEISKAEEQNFKGGPPPPGFFDKPENQPKASN